MTLPRLLSSTLLLGIFATGAIAQGTLTLFANGEELATEGFINPKLTRDGWELQFDHIFVTLAGVAALQTDPPYDAETGGDPRADVTVTFDDAEQLTIDLTNADEDGRVMIAATAAPEGHYNAVTWSVVPAEQGDWAGQSIVFIGTASRDDERVDFILTSADTHEYTCGEFVGDMRKGFVTTEGDADLELTFHLDHVFGRADRDASGDMNSHALGFDTFAAGGEQVIALSGLHIGHVGEGHCAVSYR